MVRLLLSMRRIGAGASGSDSLTFCVETCRAPALTWPVCNRGRVESTRTREVRSALVEYSHHSTRRYVIIWPSTTLITCLEIRCFGGAFATLRSEGVSLLGIAHA